jgi:hypothetical protein
MPRLRKDPSGTDDFSYDKRRSEGPDADVVSVEESDHAAISYIADIVAQLEIMARAEDFELLAYLLAMARAEADTLSRLPRRTPRRHAS